jgi:RimJ/RimL family protein N-acetyltransferase
MVIQLPTFESMEDPVSIRLVKKDDLPIFFVHQLDPEATRLAAFPSRNREAFFANWSTHILGNPAAICRTILAGDPVAGYLGAWTDAASNQRLLGYWIGREFWGRGIASAALVQFLRHESTRPLHARVAKHNLGSIRVLEKAGFVRAGEDTFPSPSGAAIEEFLYLLAA